MPRYDFACNECGEHFEKQISFQGNFSDVSCPHGHRSVRRIYSAPTVTFKGSGWYITDSRGAAASATATAASE